MGMPILTSEGLLTPRILIDDQFYAGETVRYGEPVGIREASPGSGTYRLYRALKGAGNLQELFRLLGAIHTPSGKTVGDVAADSGDLVSTFCPFGLAVLVSAGAIAAGDPVVPSDTVVTYNGASVAAVKAETQHTHTIGGGAHTHSAGGATGAEAAHSHALSTGVTGGNHSHGAAGQHSHGKSGSHQHVIAYVEGTGGGSSTYAQAQFYLKDGSIRRIWLPRADLLLGASQILSTALGGSDWEEHQHTTEASHVHSQDASHSHTGNTQAGSSHTHTLPAAASASPAGLTCTSLDRATVLGKALTKATGAGQLVTVLVNVAG